MRFLEIDGHRLGVIAEGEDRPGPPLILLHGVAFSVRFWPPNLPEPVRHHYPWYALSQPFHSPSAFPERPRDAIDAEMFSVLLSQAIRALVGDEPVILIGHSLGGFAALNLAAREPQQVRAVVAVSAIAAGHGKGVIGWWQKLSRHGPLGGWLFRALWRIIVASPRLFRFATGLCAADRRKYFFSPQANETYKAMLPDLRHHDLHALQTLMERLDEADIFPELPQIQAPTLLIAGEDDPVVSLSHQQRIAEAVPNCELQVLKHCGHMFFAECPDQFATILEEWLRRVAPR